MNNLPEIHDIYVPEGVSVFPLAYGWWVILAVALCSVLFIKILLWSIKTSKKVYALKKLKKIEINEPVDAAVQISELLRRICAYKYKEASALYGNEWIDFLNNHCSVQLSKDAANLLVYAPFMDKKDNTYDSTTALELKTFSKHWVGANL